jgi:hypothetical protein
MVPVPEELAPKVLTYVSWKGHPRLWESEPTADARPTTGEVAPPDEVGEPLARMFARLDDAGRSLVDVVAGAALEQERLTVPEVARRVGLTTREVVGMIIELNNLVPSEGGPALAVFIKDLEGVPTGEFAWDTRIVVMPEGVARPLAELARAHRGS